MKLKAEAKSQAQPPQSSAGWDDAGDDWTASATNDWSTSADSWGTGNDWGSSNSKSGDFTRVCYYQGIAVFVMLLLAWRALCNGDIYICSQGEEEGARRKEAAETEGTG